VFLLPSFVFITSVVCWFVKPEIVQYIFLANLWLLSYPHTFATFTRSYFSKKENKSKAFLTICSFFVFNLWILYAYDFVMLINIYFYSQFFHYMRQNFGISKLGSQFWKSSDTVGFHLFHFFLLIFFFRNDHSFLGYKMFQPVMSHNLYDLSGLLVLFITLYFIGRFKSICKRTYIYLGLGALMTYNETSFILGWLGLHLFHNSQYLVMSWKLNPKENFFLYYGKVILLVFIVYKSFQAFENQFMSGLAITFCLILAINYSHYLFDSYLWKRHFRLYYP
jgi:hypothetical protein